jgi:hypothetical protein
MTNAQLSQLDELLAYTGQMADAEIKFVGELDELWRGVELDAVDRRHLRRLWEGRVLRKQRPNAQGKRRRGVTNP